MAVTVEEIQIVVEAQVNDARRGLSAVERDSNNMVSSLKKTAKIIAGGAVTGLIVKSFIEIGKQSLQAASDAEETLNKFTVVFGSVADEAEASADRIKDEFKLSDETIQNFLSGVGDITSGLGATGEEALKAAEDITTLGLDINSFANLSGGAEQAVSALTSLFTGEREAAKALGIVINDTNLKAYAEDMGKVFKELTPLEKGFLSLELATKQSELAIGDFARSSDSYANTVKAASEATKDLKAALGVSLLPTATEAVGIFSELASKMAEVVKEHNELQAIVGRFEAGNASAQDRVDIAQKEVELLREQITKERAHLKILEESGITSQKVVDGQKEIISGLIDEIRLASDLASHYSKIAKAEKEIADAEKARLAEIERRTRLELEASSQLDSRRKDRLTDEELLLTNLQQQIDYWAGFREIVGVQELLNDLIEERNILLEESKVAAEDMGEALKGSLNEASDLAIGAAFDMEQFAKSIINVATSSLSTLGQGLVEEGASFQLFGKIALGVLADVLSALGAQLAAQAALAFFGPIPNPASGAGLLAGSSAAFLASGVVRGASNVAFAEGGSFLTNGSQNITVGDNAGGVERVTVEPVSSVGQNQEQGIGSSGTMILNIDGQQFTGWLQDQLDNGELRVPRRLVV